MTEQLIAEAPPAPGYFSCRRSCARWDSVPGTSNFDENDPLNAVELATELTIAWLSNPNTRASAEEVPAFEGKSAA